MKKIQREGNQPKIETFLPLREPLRCKVELGSHYQNCPICAMQICSNLMNGHIDICLVRNDATTLDRTNSKVDLIQVPEYSFDLKFSSDIPGLMLISNFVSDEEEKLIIDLIDQNFQTPWHQSSFNGRCLSKVYGLRTQFGLPAEERCVRQNDPALGEHDIPDFLHPYPLRLSQFISMVASDSRFRSLIPLDLLHFCPNECNCNSYTATLGHYLRPHYDDRSLSGPLLMNLSLGCDAIMTYVSPQGKEIPVLLPRKTLQIVTGPSRWDYQHSIKEGDVQGLRRVSVTWRQVGSKRTGIRGKRKSCSSEEVSSSPSVA
jgi:alkylated DNA repair dioxygenase AlkB